MIITIIIIVYNQYSLDLVVGYTNNFHFDTIPSSLEIIIDGGIKYDTDT